MNKQKIAIVGSGSWGDALAKLYKEVADVTVFTRASSIEDITNCDLIFLVIPAQAIRSFCQSIAGKIKQDAVIIICSKGIEEKTGYLMSEIVQKILPNNKVAILSGPNFANEIKQGLPAVSSIACSDIATATHLAKILSTDNFKLYPNQDIIGTQLYGALKNVLAIMCGIVVGFELGENAKAALITKGIKEIDQLIKSKNADHKTILEPAGVGDLFLTCNSTQSRNTSLGIKISQSGFFNEKLSDQHVEGVYTAKALSKTTSLPIFDLICKIINEGLKIDKEMIRKIIL